MWKRKQVGSQGWAGRSSELILLRREYVRGESRRHLVRMVDLGDGLRFQAIRSRSRKGNARIKEARDEVENGMQNGGKGMDKADVS